MTPSTEGADLAPWRHRGVLAGVLVAMLSNGLQTTVLGLRAHSEHFGATSTGLVMAGSYVGLLAGSISVPRLLARASHRRISSVCIVTLSLTMPIFLFLHTAAGWFALRALSGLALSGIYVTNESWFNLSASALSRTSAIARYMSAVYGGLIVGQLLVPLVNPNSSLGLVLPACCMALGLVFNRGLSTDTRQQPDERSISLRSMVKLSPLGSFGCIAYGVSQGVYFGMAPVMSTDFGFSTRETAEFMAAGTFGALVSQIWADRMAAYAGRLALIAVGAIGSAFAAASMAYVASHSRAALLILAAVWGACSMPLYSLIVAETSDRVHTRDLVAISGYFLLLYGVGAVIGPLLTGLFMQIGGPRALFGVLCATSLCVASLTWWESRVPIVSAWLPLDK